MKTMPILIAMLLAGSAFGAPILDVDKIVEENRAFYDRQMEGSYKLLDSIHSNEEACRPVSSSKVEYSIITLPNAETASVLTFK